MNDEKTKDLILHHRGETARGDQVFDAYSIEDRHEMKNRIFEIYINDHPSVNPLIRYPIKTEGHGTG